MIRTLKLRAWFLGLVPIVLAGCQQPHPDMTGPPPRAVELDQLNDFVGNWSGTANMRMAGSDEEMTVNSTSRVEWSLDKRVLIENAELDMGDQGTLRGMGVWAWDSVSHKYRTWWFDNWGSVEEGSVTYDAPTRTWRMRSKSTNPQMGRTVGEGSVRVLDDGAMEWSYTQWGPFKLKKYLEMTGTSHRE